MSFWLQWQTTKVRQRKNTFVITWEGRYLLKNKSIQKPKGATVIEQRERYMRQQLQRVLWESDFGKVICLLWILVFVFFKVLSS